MRRRKATKKPRSITKIVLITGYLGAGKTTLLNYILKNDHGIRAAVIVNDIGEINVDAGLIAQGGMVDMGGSTLVPLTNGCICCTLSDDLSRQLRSFAQSGAFDYVVIEASGICEPIPIAYTISALCQADAFGSAPMALDNIVAVVDCARMFDEFGGGRELLDGEFDEDDVRSLLVQQLEFCTTVLLNKADLVTSEQLAELRAIVRSLQRKAVIVESVRGEVPLRELLNTGRFNFNEAYESAAWIDAMDHPEEHENPEALEYDIATFVYRGHQAFSRAALENYALRWPSTIIRCKGMLYFDDEPDMCYIFEQSGRQFVLTPNGRFVVSADPVTRDRILAENPWVAQRWDPVYGDRQVELVFIGQHMDQASIEADLNGCLSKPS